MSNINLGGVDETPNDFLIHLRVKVRENDQLFIPRTSPISRKDKLIQYE